VPLIVFQDAALADLERLADFLRSSDPVAASETAQLIIGGLRVLASHPLIGRPLENAHRELLVHRGRTGYVVQYRYDIDFDRVLVVSIRHQRELTSGTAATGD
jgi:plasmid stabilization system protein ParE